MLCVRVCIAMYVLHTYYCIIFYLKLLIYLEVIWHKTIYPCSSLLPDTKVNIHLNGTTEICKGGDQVWTIAMNDSSDQIVWP